MPEEKKRSGRKVNAWIPDDLYYKVDDLKYKTWTEAIVTGLEILVQKSTDKSTVDDSQVQKSTDKSTVDDSQVQKSTDKSTVDDTEVQKSTDKSTVDDTEVQKVQLENDGELRELRVQVREQREHIETLKGELEKAHLDKDNIRNLYDNYMRQMQTLIQQKAIEAPGEKKRWWKFW